MDVTRMKKIASVIGGFALTLAISAPASAAWTQVPIPAQYSSSIASLRLCKTLLTGEPQYPAWQVQSELTRITSNVNANTVKVRFSPGSWWFIPYVSTSFDSTNTARVTAFGTAAAGTRFSPAVSFNGSATLNFPEMAASQIADC